MPAHSANTVSMITTVRGAQQVHPARGRSRSHHDAHAQRQGEEGVAERGEQHLPSSLLPVRVEEGGEALPKPAAVIA